MAKVTSSRTVGTRKKGIRWFLGNQPVNQPPRSKRERYYGQKKSR